MKLSMESKQIPVIVCLMAAVVMSVILLPTSAFAASHSYDAKFERRIYIGGGTGKYFNTNNLSMSYNNKSNKTIRILVHDHTKRIPVRVYEGYICGKCTGARALVSNRQGKYKIALYNHSRSGTAHVTGKVNY
ncbi:hypothetical protein [Desmospora profundinema]|uniref:Uncharacterized protein n=1 Tax=Desmospora profundinema TaxID=1571184 RepID=A0ABU1IL58_9BACL|nr:hypothetical protein [Desmospora profundinema]MDR6225506.1 hypothetical protein [Desmospora profundinema]